MKKEMKKPKRFADGGDSGEDSIAGDSQEVASNDGPSQDDISQYQVPQAQAAPDAPAVSAAPQDTPAAPPPQQQAQAPAEEAPAEEKQEPTSQPSQQMAQNDIPAPTQITPVSGSELKQESDATASDLANGHIHPKDYKELVADKGIFGKIGTLFGLMVSGAGSGLSHQPNMLMEMMNREIQNDLQAQTQSASNAQNLVRLNQAGAMNQAQIAQLKKSGQLTDAQAHLMEADAQTKAFALSNIQFNHQVLHDLVSKVNKYPPGTPERAEAEQKLGLISDAIQNENYNLADRAEASSKLRHVIFNQNPGNSSTIGQTNGQNDPEKEFQDNQTFLRSTNRGALADDLAQRHMPGVPGRASIPLTPDNRNAITSGTTFQNKLDDFMNWTKAHSGSLNWKDREYGQSLAAGLQGAYRTVTNGGVYKEGEQNFINKIIADTPTKFFNNLRVMPQLQAIKDSTTADLDQHLKSLGFQGYQPSATAVANRKIPNPTKGGNTAIVNNSGPQEGTSMVSKSGRPMTFKNGNWTYDSAPTGVAAAGD